MPTFLEIATSSERRVFSLNDVRHTLGKGPDNDIVVEDPAVSRLHAVFERYGSEWAVRDLGSRNGTFVNGDRIIQERRLTRGDEIRVGTTVLIVKADVDGPEPTKTQAAEPPPELTRREREVLICLCRPVLSGAMFTRPSSIKQIAAELFVTENAVKQHLGRLYDKFGIHSSGEPRIHELANEAIRRGAVSLSDLREG